MSGGKMAANVIGTIGEGVINGVTSYLASEDVKRGINQGKEDLTKYTDKAAGYQQGYYDTGSQSLASLGQGMQNREFQTDPYNYQSKGFDYKQSPAYQFQVNQGMGAIQGGSAARGGLLSGHTIKALQTYGAGAAASDYQNMFNQYSKQEEMNMTNAARNYDARNQQATNRFNQFSSMAGMGQNASTNLSNMYTSQGSNFANMSMGYGNAQAAATIGIGNAVGDQFRWLAKQGGGGGTNSQNGGGNTGVSGGMGGGSGQGGMQGNGFSGDSGSTMGGGGDMAGSAGSAAA